MNYHVFQRRVLRGGMFSPPRNLVTQGDGEGSCMVYAIINLIITNEGLWKHLSTEGLEWFLNMMQEGDVTSCDHYWYDEIKGLFTCEMKEYAMGDLESENLTLPEFLYYIDALRGSSVENELITYPSELILFQSEGMEDGHVLCTTDDESETTFVDSHGEVWRFSTLMTDGKIDKFKVYLLSTPYSKILSYLSNISFKYDKDAEIPEYLKPHQNLFMDLNALPKTVGSNMMQTWLNFKSRSRLNEGDEPIPFNLPD